MFKIMNYVRYSPVLIGIDQNEITTTTTVTTKTIEKS